MRLIRVICLSTATGWFALHAPVAMAQVSLTTLYAFSGTDGATPYGGLTRDGKGNLYGVTGMGGANNMGKVYELKPPVTGSTAWTYVPVWDFSGTDGNYSETTLLRDSAGHLYGTMVNGGANNLGTVFMLTPPARHQTAWTLQILWNFGGPDGANPYNGLLADAAGNLYGTTPYGGANNIGAVYELSPPAAGTTAWTEQVLWSFVGPEGQTPVGVPFMDSAGNIYGAAQWGGTSDDGTIYELSPPAAGQTEWTAQALAQFAGQSAGDVMTPYPMLTVPSGAKKFFGTSLAGGPDNDGTVFELNAPTRKNPSWSHTVLWSFSNTDGCCSFGKLLMDANGALYGTTGFQGPNNDGTVFKLTPPPAGQAQWTETVLWTFSGPDGANPGDGLIADANGVLYGTTGAGGPSNDGTVFALTGTGFAVKVKN